MLLAQEQEPRGPVMIALSARQQRNKSLTSLLVLLAVAAAIVPVTSGCRGSGTPVVTIDSGAIGGAYVNGLVRYLGIP